MCKEFDKDEKENFAYVTSGWEHRSKEWSAKLRDFKQIGAIVASFEQKPNAKFSASYDYDKSESFSKLLLGFPSINVPSKSDAVYWLLNGRYFGSEHLMNGDFTIESINKDYDRSNFGVDGGPLMITHKNGKDVIIVSPMTMRSFQKFNTESTWYDDFSSPLEQSMRIKKLDSTMTIEYGFGEAIRDGNTALSATDLGDIKTIRSETIFVTSDQGPSAAIEKYGKIMTMFQRLLATDCPCSICKSDRQVYADKVRFLDKLGYSLEKGTHHYFNTAPMATYDDVVSNVMEKMNFHPQFIETGQ